MSKLSSCFFLLSVFICFNSYSRDYSEAPIDATLENQRAVSATTLAVPEITAIQVNGNTLWTAGQPSPAQLRPGQWVTVLGTGFGNGPNIDYAKILVGNVRAVERDVNVYQGTVNLLRRVFYETPEQFDQWQNDIRLWTDTQIEFRVPVEASRGPIVVQVQKRIGGVPSLFDAARAHSVWDPMTERIQSQPQSSKAYDVISLLGPPVSSNEVPVDITNPSFNAMVSEGEAIFWTYDFNIGIVHHLNKMDWPSVLSGKAIDPTTGKPGDPQNLFGAIPVVPGEVPSVVTEGHYFDPYPAPNPLKPVLRKPLYSGSVASTGFVGYDYAESIHPMTQLKGNWIGFSCASCHAQRITYEESPGKTVSRVFPGLPNNSWSMKWNVLGHMKTVTGNETGPDGTVGYVDKTQLIYAVPPGTGEASLVRGADDDSPYANDYLFSPIAIPIITRHTPVRRALSRSELIVGFEGSYAHAEEPDGGIGALLSGPLQDLTAYMSTLDKDDTLLERVGIYRWLKRNGVLDEVSSTSEGAFVQQGPEAFPKLWTKVQHGQQIFNRDCLSCHRPNFGTNSDENMFPLSQVGTYFSPTIFQLQTQSIRTSITRNLFWLEGRGLLHDGHVKSLEDLVSPDRCTQGTDLYNKYYTIHPGSFHIPKGTAAQELALRRTAYFVDVSFDKKSLYWDYQTMRKSFGPREVGAKSATPLPAAPHPWCAQSANDVGDLIRYLLTL